jgi:hypothetical protein
MKTEDKRTCPSCGSELSEAAEFCPVCLLRKGLAGGVESGESSASEEAVNPMPEQATQRFEHYELVTGEDGKPVELGRGAMGVTYKAYAKLAQRRSCGIQTLPRCCIWAELGAVTSTRWSLWREKRWRISSNVQGGLK